MDRRDLEEVQISPIEEAGRKVRGERLHPQSHRPLEDTNEAVDPSTQTARGIETWLRIAAAPSLQRDVRPRRHRPLDQHRLRARTLERASDEEHPQTRVRDVPS